MHWGVVLCWLLFGAWIVVSEEERANETITQMRMEIDDDDADAEEEERMINDYVEELLEEEEEEENAGSVVQRIHPMLEPPGHHEIIAGVHFPGPLSEYISDVHKYWEPFKEVHKKRYKPYRNAKRKKKWVENLLRVHNHNERAREGEHKYFLRANHLSDLTVREYIRQMVKLHRSIRDRTPPSPRSTYVKRNIKVPEEWNWVEKGFVTPMWDQERCGSCYAFSIAASAQGQYFRKTGQLKNLSVQQIVDCSVAAGNFGCYGGSLRNALRYCSHAGGLMLAEEYPYRARQRFCRYRPWHSSVNITSYVILPENDEEAIQEAVATQGPVACSLDASPYTFQLYHKGIYDDASCSKHKVNHAMLIVGYTKDAWILKNWWGEHWGVNGYMYLKRGVNQCAVAKYVGYPVVDETPLDDDDDD